MVDNLVICSMSRATFRCVHSQVGTDYETENLTILVKEDSKSECDTV